MPSKQELEERVGSDFQFAVGQTLLVQRLDGFGADGGSTLWELDPSIRVEVRDTEQEDLIRWLPIGEQEDRQFIDPVWTVLPLEQRSELAGCSEFWVHGGTYDRDGGVPKQHDWEFANSNRQAIHLSHQRYLRKAR